VAVSEFVIGCVYYDSAVPGSESDEYVSIVNAGRGAGSLAGWCLTDIDDGSPTIEFPPMTLEPGETVRVYTNEIHPEHGALSFGRGSPIWNNSDPDTAALISPNGEVVSSVSYPPGC
jgi:hypothetical protein